MSGFDPAGLGLESHYTHAQQQIMKRWILEDWKKAQCKLPTYMKLLARYIIPIGIPDEWLKKLSHQTMSKMLTGQSTPRHAFWACLHLYLMKKYGDIGLTPQRPNDIDLLGQAMMKFGNTKDASSLNGSYHLDSHTAIALQATNGFTRLAVIERFHSDEPFSEPVYSIYQGAGITQDKKLTGLLRDLTTRTIKALETLTNDLQTLRDDDLQNRLEALP